MASSSDKVFDVDTLPTKDPLRLFQKWHEQAKKAEGIRMASVAVLSTASRDGHVTSRIMTVKEFDKDGFRFATNENSRKAKQLDENPYASLLFDWEPVNRMVRIDGKVTKLSEEASTAIWKTYSRSAQLLHSVSQQDDVIKSSKEVSVRKEELEKKHGRSAPIPWNSEWCAYELSPHSCEFYQMDGEVPTRICFRRPYSGEFPDDSMLHRGEDGWVIETLSP